MPSAYQSKALTDINLGVNLRGLTGGVSMRPGEAQDALDILPREDGAVYKHHGWERLSTSALTGTPLHIQGFAYKGKNNAVTGASDTARPGNWGIADDGNDFTRRQALYTGCLVFTDSTIYRWEPNGQTFQSVSLPSGVTILAEPRASTITYNNNVYICGFADANLRYDPTDETLYRWGWNVTPTAPTSANTGSGGSLINGAVYNYAYSFLDVYTGEESQVIELAAPETGTSTGQVTITLTAYANAATNRHFNDLNVATDSDVGYVLYRTDADRTQLNFLTVVNPGTTTVIDNGAATEASIQPYQRTQTDEPNFSFMTLFKDQFYAVSRSVGAAQQAQPANASRIYWNDFNAENSFVERWSVTGYRELPLPQGEQLTAIASTDSHLIPFTQRGAYGISVTPNYASGKVSRVSNRLPWNVGCIGAKAHTTVNGWLYFLSDRGPYRFRSGTGNPQWIGKNLLPLFIDPTSGLCKLNPGSRELAEVEFDADANVVRYVFAVGSATTMNRHLMYWVDGDKFLPAPEYGWFFASTRAQCFDFTSSLAGLDGSASLTPFQRFPRMIFGDDDGFINTYEPTSKRGGLPSGLLTTGAVVTGSTTTSLVCTTTASPLLTDGDGLEDLRVEVLYADGHTEVRGIASNTTTAVVPDVAFTTAPTTSATWYIAGIPSFWRSWVDSLGEPHARKTLLHLYLSHQREFDSGTHNLTVTVSSGDYDLAVERPRTSSLTDYQEKMLISRTGLFFTYDIANTLPDEMFTLTALEAEFRILGEKRKE